MKKFLGTLSLCLAAGAVQAHGLWIAQRGGQLAAVYGEGAEDEAYDPAAIGKVAAWTAEGRQARWRSETRPAQWVFIPEEPVSRLSLTYDAGEWTETTAGRWLPGGRMAALPQARRTWRLLRYASALFAPAPSGTQPLGLPLEIVPLQALQGLRKGDRLALRVLLHGRPLAGAKVIADFVNDDRAPPLRTDRDGVTMVRLGSDTLNVIQASHAEDCPGDCAVDRLAHSTTLSFTVARPTE